MNKWDSHIRSAVVGVASMCVFNIGMVIWWAAKLDYITISAVTRTELAIRDERIHNNGNGIKANKLEWRRTDDKIDRILQLLTNRNKS